MKLNYKELKQRIKSNIDFILLWNICLMNLIIAGIFGSNLEYKNIPISINDMLILVNLNLGMVLIAFGIKFFRRTPITEEILQELPEEEKD